MKSRNDHFIHKPIPERLAVFGGVFMFWLLLVWPVSPLDGSLRWGDILAGVVVSAFVALVMREMNRVTFIRLIKPSCWFCLFVYTFVFN
mgnify:FL=1